MNEKHQHHKSICRLRNVIFFRCCNSFSGYYRVDFSRHSIDSWSFLLITSTMKSLPLILSLIFFSLYFWDYHPKELRRIKSNSSGLSSSFSWVLQVERSVHYRPYFTNVNSSFRNQTKWRNAQKYWNISDVDLKELL